MSIAQAETDTLVAPPAEPAPPVAAESEQPAASSSPAAAPPRASAAQVELQRILHFRVPVIVRLARRTMPVASVRALSVGAVIEFDKSVEDPLDLLVNNHLIGRGHCVKVGENFGLHLARICDPTQRVRLLGPT